MSVTSASDISTEDACILNQGSDFVSKAIDVAVKELIAVATPGEGFLQTLTLFSNISCLEYLIC